MTLIWDNWGAELGTYNSCYHSENDQLKINAESVQFQFDNNCILIFETDVIEMTIRSEY